MTPAQREACLERTRSSVLNILMVQGAAIAACGWILGRRAFGEVLIPPEQGSTWFFYALAGVAALYYLARWLLGRTRASEPLDPGRFYRAHIAGALIGALAIPLSFAYGWLIRPRPIEIIPFWVVGMTLGLLSYPRSDEILEPSDRSPSLPDTPRSRAREQETPLRP